MYITVYSSNNISILGKINKMEGYKSQGKMIVIYHTQQKH